MPWGASFFSVAFGSGTAYLPFDYGGGALPAANGLGYQRSGFAAPLKFVSCRAEQHCAGRAQRMAERVRAAVNVDKIGIDFERPSRLQHDAGEGFIDFP